MDLTFLEIGILFGVLQAFLLGLALVITPRRYIFRKIFGFLLISEGLVLLESFLNETGLMRHAIFALGTTYPLVYLKPPLLLLFVASAP